VSLRRQLAIVAVVYVVEGFPMGVYMDVWPVFLRRHDVSNTAIGLLSAFSFAWAAKVLWSPLVDRFGERRHWIFGALGVMAAALSMLAVDDPFALGPLLWLAIGLFCVASATQDIAIDAYSIGFTQRGQEGPVNSVRVTAYRGGLIAAGTGLLFLPRVVGWGGTFASAALLCLAMALAVRVFCPPVQIPAEARRQTLIALRRWLARPGAAAVLAFILLYRVGDRAMGPMVRPFWVDRGFSDEQIGIVANGLGAVATVLGALSGGLVVARLGIARSLLVLGVLALASNLAYAFAAQQDAPANGIYVASLVESLCSGLASVAFLSYLMRITEKQHAAVQYALLTAVYALSGSLVAAPSGWLSDQLGYATYFAFTAALALPAFAFLRGASAWLELPDPTDSPTAWAPAQPPGPSSTPPAPPPDSPRPRAR
jgi:PAT family beta-lactamase induction signal transducer AmpG